MIFVQLYIILLITSVAVSYFSVPFAERLAKRFGAIDYPDKRRVNVQPIPRMGGVAIYLTLTICSLLLVALKGFYELDIASLLVGERVDLLMVFVSLTWIFCIGCIDDVYHIKSSTKLLGQLIGAVLAASSGLVIRSISFSQLGLTFDLGLFSYPFTVFLLVAFSNIINLIDGLDGLAAGYSLIAAGTLFILALFENQLVVGLFIICLMGSLMGFLKYNFYPASVFMGDSGSLMIGFLFGLLYLLAWGNGVTFNQLAGVLILFAVPISDTTCAIIRRIRMGVSVGTADKGHIHHRIMGKGADHWRAVLHIYFWALMLSAITIWFSVSQGPIEWLIVVGLVISIVFVAHKYQVVQAPELHDERGHV